MAESPDALLDETTPMQGDMMFATDYAQAASARLSESAVALDQTDARPDSATNQQDGAPAKVGLFARDGIDE
jgi:hypothetical protein